MTTPLFVGRVPWSLTFPERLSVPINRAAITPPTGTAAELMRAALEKPFGFEPLRRALTPGDRITVVLDPLLPQLPALLGELFAHLASAGVSSETVSILTPPGTAASWIEGLTVTGFRSEVHDPADAKNLGYLASTVAGRRVYLNRAIIDGDFVIVLAGRGYDPRLGYTGAETALFPAFSNVEVRDEFAGQVVLSAPNAAEPGPIQAEAIEIVKLLGLPFFIQVIEGEGDAIQDVIAGLPESSPEGIRRQDARWRGTVTDDADTAIAVISGDPSRVTFLDLAKAALCAARVVRKGGRIAVLTEASPELGDGARLLRAIDGPEDAKKLLGRLKPSDWVGCRLWAFAAKSRSLFLASGYPHEVVEELFATSIRTPNEVQRLIDGGGSVLFIPDAHKTMLTPG